MPTPTHAMRYTKDQPAMRIVPPGSFSGLCQLYPAEQALPGAAGFQILVWNIFKQQRAHWLSVLEQFGSSSHLMLLQEAQASPKLVSFATRYYQTADQVPALGLPPHSCGVMTLATVHPLYCCPLREREPILRLTKSALVTIYPLPARQLLMVVNIHAINFSFGTEVYNKQLRSIGDHISRHQGPVIMAGDFNAWSRSRIHALYRFIRKQGLKEVHFSDDHRRRAFGYPLDFVFYRHLNVRHASVQMTQASDHNPLLVEFTTLPVAANLTAMHQHHDIR